MAAFFVTTVIGHSDKPFQFVFDTDEARDITEFRELLENGAHILGRRSISKTSDKWEDTIITGKIVAFASPQRVVA
jgi:hypothetical protein